MYTTPITYCTFTVLYVRHIIILLYEVVSTSALGIQYPLCCHDDVFVAKYYRDQIYTNGMTIYRCHQLALLLHDPWPGDSFKNSNGNTFATRTSLRNLGPPSFLSFQSHQSADPFLLNTPLTHNYLSTKKTLDYKQWYLFNSY